jgi:hypothetical protein
MKILISEKQYKKVILTELSSRGVGLISYIRQKYETMGNSFTPRFSSGEIWYTKNDIRNELVNTFNLNKDFAEEIVDYYLDINLN